MAEPGHPRSDYTDEEWRCPKGHPMHVELDRPLVGGKGARVLLWYCEACDHAEHEVRQP